MQLAKSRAHAALGWKARTLTPELALIMVDADLNALSGTAHIVLDAATQRV